MKQTLLISVLVIVLMMGAPMTQNIFANQACIYGPHNDQCKYNSDYRLGFRTGVLDAHKTSGHINDDALKHTEAFNVGWAEGYCSVDQNALHIKPLFECNDDTA